MSVSITAVHSPVCHFLHPNRRTFNSNTSCSTYVNYTLMYVLLVQRVHVYCNSTVSTWAWSLAILLEKVRSVLEYRNKQYVCCTCTNFSIHKWHSSSPLLLLIFVGLVVFFCGRVGGFYHILTVHFVQQFWNIQQTGTMGGRWPLALAVVSLQPKCVLKVRYWGLRTNILATCLSSPLT